MALWLHSREGTQQGGDATEEQSWSLSGPGGCHPHFLMISVWGGSEEEENIFPLF